MKRTTISIGFPRFTGMRGGRRDRRLVRAIVLTALLSVTGAVWTAVPVHAGTLLSISQTVNGTAVVGQNLTFSVTMTNAGTASILEGIDDSPPSTATIVSVKSTGITCARASRGTFVLCSPVQIAPGASVSYDLTVRPTEDGTMTNLAEGDPDFLYSSQATVQVAPAPTDIQVTGSASTGSPPRGASYSYTFQVKDNGPWNVDDVAFSDPLPSQVSFVGVTASNGSFCTQAAGTVSCDLGPLNVGQQVNVVVNVLAPTAPSTFTNTASITPSVTDTQPSNNSVGVTVQVK